MTEESRERVRCGQRERIDETGAREFEKLPAAGMMAVPIRMKQRCTTFLACLWLVKGCLASSGLAGGCLPGGFLSGNLAAQAPQSPPAPVQRPAHSAGPRGVVSRPLAPDDPIVRAVEQHTRAIASTYADKPARPRLGAPIEMQVPAAERVLSGLRFVAIEGVMEPAGTEAATGGAAFVREVIAIDTTRLAVAAVLRADGDGAAFGELLGQRGVHVREVGDARAVWQMYCGLLRAGDPELPVARVDGGEWHLGRWVRDHVVSSQEVETTTYFARLTVDASDGRVRGWKNVAESSGRRRVLDVDARLDLASLLRELEAGEPRALAGFLPAERPGDGAVAKLSALFTTLEWTGIESDAACEARARELLWLDGELGDAASAEALAMLTSAYAEALMRLRPIADPVARFLPGAAGSETMRERVGALAELARDRLRRRGAARLRAATDDAAVASALGAVAMALEPPRRLPLWAEVARRRGLANERSHCLGLCWAFLRAGRLGEAAAVLGWADAAPRATRPLRRRADQAGARSAWLDVQRAQGLADRAQRDTAAGRLAAAELVLQTKGFEAALPMLQALIDGPAADPHAVCLLAAIRFWHGEREEAAALVARAQKAGALDARGHWTESMLRMTDAMNRRDRAALHGIARELLGRDALAAPVRDFVRSVATYVTDITMPAEAVLMREASKLLPMAVAFRKAHPGDAGAHTLLQLAAAFSADVEAASAALADPLGVDLVLTKDRVLGRATALLLCALRGAPAPAPAWDAALAAVTTVIDSPFEAAHLRGCALVHHAAAGDTAGWEAALAALRAAVPPPGSRWHARAQRNLLIARHRAGERFDLVAAWAAVRQSAQEWLLLRDEGADSEIGRLNSALVLAIGGASDEGRAALARIAEDEAVYSSQRLPAAAWSAVLADRAGDAAAAKKFAQRAAEMIEATTPTSRAEQWLRGFLDSGSLNWSYAMQDWEPAWRLDCQLEVDLTWPSPWSIDELRKRAR